MPRTPILFFADPWPGPQHIAIFEELSQIIREVDPSVVLIDPIFAPAFDAARAQNRRHAVLSPNALVNTFVTEMQPYASTLWKYPAMGSSYCRLLLTKFFNLLSFLRSFSASRKQV